MQDPTGRNWQTRDRFLKISSHWFTLIGEHLQDDRERTLEYWRIEKADSVIILPVRDRQIILPIPSYRPGLGETTWDFPGGRIPEGISHEEAVGGILQRELGIDMQAIAECVPLNTEGWAVNSSFSNQKVYGFVAKVKPANTVPEEFIGATYPATQSGICDLLTFLSCLQCRSMLLEWWFSGDGVPKPAPGETGDAHSI